MIDFEIPEETKAIRNKVRKFVQEEVIPAEENCTADNFDFVLAELRNKARGQGLWCPFVPVEHGGMGLRAVRLPRISHLPDIQVHTGRNRYTRRGG